MRMFVVLPFAVLCLAFALGGCATKAAKPVEPSAAEYFEQGKAQFDAGRFADAAENFERAAQKAPGMLDAQYYLGVSLQRSAYTGAETAYRRALSLDPDFVPAMEALGVLLYSTGKYEAAKPFLEQARARGGLGAEALFCLGDVYFFEDRCPEALAAYTESAARNPDLSSASARRAMAARHCGKAKAPAPAAPAPASAPAKSKTEPAAKAIDLNDI